MPWFQEEEASWPSCPPQRAEHDQGAKERTQDGVCMSLQKGLTTRCQRQLVSILHIIITIFLFEGVSMSVWNEHLSQRPSFNLKMFERRPRRTTPWPTVSCHCLDPLENWRDCLGSRPRMTDLLFAFLLEQKCLRLECYCGNVSTTVK